VENRVVPAWLIPFLGVGAPLAAGHRISAGISNHGIEQIIRALQSRDEEPN